ncbi:reverse transcriptase family protein [Myroides odoratimimus]|uniref:reverse transcriptase family protein n=1 Tax=Myroides odoratimimus TaxID=76832 RepID=UPI002577AA2D|nr:reverse transcriptase family protein [Myroides odoratimimus]MDM1067357.1 RNA-directed DNA polymerase [Myroides odoratimimus]
MDFPRNTYIELAKSENRSQQFIEYSLNYADNLIKQGLPVIFSLKHFSLIMGIDLHTIKEIIANRGIHYSYYLIRKKKGGYRRIIAPHKNIKFLQDWIKLNILDKKVVHHASNGFIKNKSILDNAKVHLDSDTILNIDLKNFFESINERRVFGIFKYLGYHPNLALEFAKICTVDIPDEKFYSLNQIEQENFEDLFNLNEPFLVQGAPTSPALSNITCINLDNRFQKLANKNNVKYSRYADDITFSGAEDNLPSISLLKKIIIEENFEINWKKVGKYKKGQKQLVTGLLINGSVRIPKRFKKDIFRHLYFCQKFGPINHFNKISPNKSFRKEWLMGKILYVNAVEPDVAKEMFDQFKKVNWEI